MDTSRYAELFQTESRETLAALNHALLELERRPEAPEPVGVIFRAVHTLKGMSSAMGYAAVAQLAHELETLLDRVRRGEQRVTRAVLDTCFEATDALESATALSAQGRAAEADVAAVLKRLAECSSPPGASGTTAALSDQELVARSSVVPAPDGERSPMQPRARRHARIDVSRLDALVNLIGELVIARDRLLEQEAGDSAPSETVSHVSRLVTELQDEIMRCRMVPVWQVFDRFPRLVRDASRALGKQIDFSVEGKDIELDRALLDEIGEPIVHLLRNAVDHGIEAPALRTAAGKPPSGQLCLSAARERSSVAIRVTDDGRGIDRERVLAKARELGLVEGSTAALADDELMRLISQPGLSTAERVTDLSGRGIGIDAVHSRVRVLGGSMEIKSLAGAGTTVTLRLPLTLAVVRALLARVADETYVVPMTHVNGTAELQGSAVRQIQGQDVLLLREHVMPLIRLRDLVRLPTPVDAPSKVLVLEIGERRAALVVDDLLGQQDVIVKQFNAARGAVPLFSGATILGDGAPALIVDVGSLL